MTFKNDTDREIYLFLLMFQKYVDKEITKEQFMQYIDDTTPDEVRNKRIETESRTERTTKIIETIKALQKHINETYFEKCV